MIDTDNAENSRSWFLKWGIIGVAIIVISGALGFLIAGSIPQNTQVLVYTTLAAGQASVLAIVFSVMFISTQVASERYSPHFANLFTNNEFVKLGLSIGIISIALDVIAVTISHSLLEVFSNNKVLWALGGMIIGINFAFLVFLYPTISEILLASKPTNLLENHRQKIQPSEYISKALEANDRQITAKHPIQPNFDLVRNSIQRNEISVAIAGVDSLFEVTKYMVREISEGDIQGKNEDEGMAAHEIFDVLYKPIFDVYAKDIIEISNDKGLKDISRNTIRNIQELGTTAISDYELNRQVVYSSFDALFNLTEDSTHPISLREISLSESIVLLSSSAKKNEIFKELVPKAVVLINTVNELGDPRWANTLLKSLSGEYEKIVNESSFEGVSERTLSWDRSSPNGPIALVLMMMMVTSENIYESSVQGNILDSWEKLVKSANGNAPKEHQQSLLKRYIEILLFFDLEEVDTPINPKHRLDALIAEDNLEEAFNDMLDSSEGVEWKFIERSVSTIWNPLPLCDYDADMEDILVQFKG